MVNVPQDKKSYLFLPLWIFVYLGVARLIGDMTRKEIPGWYESLAKPALNPPDIAFPIVWTTLYIFMAVVGWRIWQRRDSSGGEMLLTFFAIQTIVNWAWSYWFFDFHELAISFFWILGLIGLVGWLIFKLWRFDRISAYLLLPYLAWISFASYLNGMIWHLNG